MREIKFRGLDVKTKKWVYGYYFEEAIEDEDSEGFIYKSFIKSEYGDHYLDYEININTVGQYTGLRDKNGVEIYEGDIVSVPFTTGDMINRTDEELASKNPINYEVYFRDGCFEMYDKDGDYTGDLKQLNSISEVLGNIYENPYLL